MKEQTRQNEEEIEMTNDNETIQCNLETIVSGKRYQKLVTPAEPITVVDTGDSLTFRKEYGDATYVIVTFHKDFKRFDHQSRFEGTCSIDIGARTVSCFEHYAHTKINRDVFRAVAEANAKAHPLRLLRKANDTAVLSVTPYVKQSKKKQSQPSYRAGRLYELKIRASCPETLHEKIDIMFEHIRLTEISPRMMNNGYYFQGGEEAADIFPDDNHKDFKKTINHALVLHYAFGSEISKKRPKGSVHTALSELLSIKRIHHRVEETHASLIGDLYNRLSSLSERLLRKDTCKSVMIGNSGTYDGDELKNKEIWDSLCSNYPNLNTDIPKISSLYTNDKDNRISERISDKDKKVLRMIDKQLDLIASAYDMVFLTMECFCCFKAYRPIELSIYQELASRMGARNVFLVAGREDTTLAESREYNPFKYITIPLGPQVEAKNDTQ
jgi:hypothetical protein